MAAAKKSCFIIGPMRSPYGGRLEALRHYVVEPALGPDWDVRIPSDHSSDGQILREALSRIDDADLLVADLSGSNPNVLYELAVRHGLGLPFVLLNDGSEPVAFDVENYRYHLFNAKQNDLDKWLNNGIRNAFASAKKDVEAGVPIGNPISDFYGRPLATLSQVYGSTTAYYQNFVQPVMAHMNEQRSSGALPELHFEIWIPDRVEGAESGFIRDHLLHPNIVEPYEIPVSPRPYKLYAIPPEKLKKHTLVDVPTVIGTIAGQNGRNRKVESREIGRFEQELISQLNKTTPRSLVTNVSVHHLNIATRVRSLSWPPSDEQE